MNKGKKKARPAGSVAGQAERECHWTSGNSYDNFTTRAQSYIKAPTGGTGKRHPPAGVGNVDQPGRTHSTPYDRAGTTAGDTNLVRL